MNIIRIMSLYLVETHQTSLGKNNEKIRQDNLFALAYIITVNKFLIISYDIKMKTESFYF